MVSTLTLFSFTILTLFCENYAENITYTTKYDNVDLEEILQSKRLLGSYVKCLLERGPCTPDGTELKNNLPDAIANDCSRCTPRQRDGSTRVMRHLIDYNPDDWIELEKMYDVSGSYRKKYLESKVETENSDDTTTTGAPTTEYQQ